MILACPGCDGRYDVTGHPIGQRFRCRCGTVITLEAPSKQVGMLACPHCGAGVSPACTQCSHCDQHLLLKACPRCLSRVFAGHKHCPECGSGISEAAIAAANQDRACPRCDQALGPRLVGDVVIDECMGCRGLFLDETAVKRIVTDRQQSRAESLLGALPRLEGRTPLGSKLYIKCPVCRVVMNRKLFASGTGVVIDVCRQHGTFFDAGELPRIIEFVMNGGLEAAQKKELERMRDQVRREKDQAGASSSGLAMLSQPMQERNDAGGALVSLLWNLFK